MQDTKSFRRPTSGGGYGVPCLVDASGSLFKVGGRTGVSEGGVDARKDEVKSGVKKKCGKAKGRLW
jgi:hypothetical protein